MTVYDNARKFIANQAIERKCFVNSLVAAQKDCSHNRILHWTGEYSSGSITFPMRVCLECGVEETGSWWSYSGHHWASKEFINPPVLGEKEGRTIEIEKNIDKFHAKRLGLINP